MRYAVASLIAVGLCAAGAGQALGQTPPPDQPDASPEASRFQTCLRDVDLEAERRGISRALLDRSRIGLSPDPDVTAAVGSQAEFERPLWEYLDAAVSEARVGTGQAKLAEGAAVLADIETRFGVDRHVLVAIWGIESSYGAMLDDSGVVRPVVRSLATLACGDASRSAFWRDQLLAALEMLDQGDVTPDRMTGSWAGAMGHTQFMPTTYQSHAVDFDGDGKRDIWSIPDALASTANYLRSLGWRPGERWGHEVELPPGFDYSLADETTDRPLSGWIALGLRLSHDPSVAAPDASAVLVLPAGSRGPAFLLLPNFRAILRYNTALAYALSVAHLSDRLQGGTPFARSWPRHDRMLTNAERKDVQALLGKLGFDPGTVDGKIGPRTRAAIRGYQASVGLLPDGYANEALLERVRARP
jgi:membrane-bound lytic murein transglycosylase B